MLATAKYIFLYILVLFFIIKLLGFKTYTGFFLNDYYIKIYFYVSAFIVVSIFILQIILLHLFVNNKIKINELLPNFIIDWLETIKYFSETKEAKERFKNESYINIGVCFLIIIFFTLVYGS